MLLNRATRKLKYLLQERKEALRKRIGELDT